MRNRFTVKEPPYETKEKKYQRFSSSDHAFSVISKELTGEADPHGFLGKIMPKQAENIEKGKSGYSREDYALDVGAQAINLITGEYGEGSENRHYLKWDPLFVPDHMRKPPPDGDPESWTESVKSAAKLYGADLVGCAKLDRKWVYSSNVYKPITFEDVKKPKETEEAFVIPESFNHAIVMAIEMDMEMTKRSPRAPAATATDIGYSKMGVVSISLAEFIRAMGYNAIPCMNDTALSIPLAIDAGLGQLGRNGLLITPEYGPCVRLCKVLTDMPLEADSPIDFGVTEFCEQCQRCVEACPVEAISGGDMTFEAVCRCNNPEVKKWYVDTEECLRFWLENGIWCSNCIAACPFTLGFGETYCPECESCVAPDCPVYLTSFLYRKNKMEV